ncbi:twin-arginine translocase TatA/TatE family subunit [Isoptericola halotolerans]|uniref:twin-arginine translocase TatA/TatE family subunit n=1 Tax=Isoptericola halotolerans TaxID=300560 RepID=UPI00388E7B11
MGIFRNPAVIITLILLVVVLFGARRLPDVARSVGSSLKIFKKEVRELRDDDEPRPDTTGRPDASSGTSGTTASSTPASSTAAQSTPPSSTSTGDGPGEPRNL